MPNRENIDKFNADKTRRTHEEMSRRGKKGVESQRRKRLLKDSLELLLSQKVTNKTLANKVKKLGIEDEDINNQLIMCLSIYNKALDGDVQAFNSIRDTIGQKPVDEVKMNNVSEKAVEIENYIAQRKKANE